MKTVKRLLIGFLAIFTLLLCFTLGASAEFYTDGDYQYVILDDGTVEIAHYNGTASEVAIPSELSGMTVTSLGNSCFSTHHVTSIIIPDSVMNIGFAAFSGCYNLKKLTIGKGVETIDNNAWNNSRLETITVDKDNAYFSSDEYGVLYNKDKTKIVKYPEENKREEYEILNSVAVIGYKAFASAEYLESVIIPNSVKTIEISAFAGANLKEIKIPDSVTTIEKYAFLYCEEKELIIPDSVVEIGEEAFQSNNELEKITIGKNVKNIGIGAFSLNEKLVSITVNLDNKYFSNDENGILYNKDKTKLIQYPIGNKKSVCVIPDGVEEVVDYAFSFPTNSSVSYLTYLIMPDSIRMIGENAFYFFENSSEGTYITDVYFKGSQARWNNIIIEEGNEDLINSKIHFDANSDGFCDDCGESYDKDLNCSHLCHNEKGFYKNFLYPMLKFFWKIFGKNKYCSCGMAHY